MITFAERAADMGLVYNASRKEYFYNDRYSRVLYKELTTPPPNPTASDRPPNETDGYEPGLLAVFTKPPTDVQNPEWAYVGYVSRLYKFIGNEQFTNTIRASINEVGMPIINETPIMSWKYTQFRNEMTVQNGVNVPEQGDVFPAMIVKNTYDGGGAQSLQFGMVTNDRNYRNAFGFSLGEMKQIHVAGANTVISASVESYVQVFSNSITEMITESFHRELTEQQMFGVLDIVENIGKKRREEISKIITEMTGGEGNMPSAWQVFLAITRYSSLEPNLNAKSLLENAAESVLVIPPRMIEVLERLQN